LKSSPALNIEYQTDGDKFTHYSYIAKDPHNISVFYFTDELVKPAGVSGVHIGKEYLASF
jgi:hypothetical protein